MLFHFHLHHKYIDTILHFPFHNFLQKKIIIFINFLNFLVVVLVLVLFRILILELILFILFFLIFIRIISFILIKLFNHLLILFFLLFDLDLNLPIIIKLPPIILNFLNTIPIPWSFIY